MSAVSCPVCSKRVKQIHINSHLDSGCDAYVESETSSTKNGIASTGSTGFFNNSVSNPRKEPLTGNDENINSLQQGHPPLLHAQSELVSSRSAITSAPKRKVEYTNQDVVHDDTLEARRAVKRLKPLSAAEKAAPLADRMRPNTLDDVHGQELVGPSGILRGLIESDRVPSMILWGGPGTGKTTIARLIAKTAGTRFAEINSTSSGVAECKKLFTEARNELSLTSRKTIIFCDEIHRFSKSQQDVFLGPVEAGQVTLIGATTENPSFKVINALLSRCRVFTLAPLAEDVIVTILRRALNNLHTKDDSEDVEVAVSPLLNDQFLHYLASAASGDARTALNLFELSESLIEMQPEITPEELKKRLTVTMVYDRVGDAHYNTISAFHKSVRGSDPDAALYYLARMLDGGEDALFIARRLVVMASEDIGLGDNSMLGLATSALIAAEKIGMPEARINLAHATVALSLAPKSIRAYKALGKAMAAIKEPGLAGLPIPLHLMNAPTRLMKDMGYGKEYKYNPHFQDGRVVQEYLPTQIQGRRFLEDADLGSAIDPDLLD